MQELISIIVPVYNAERYLSRCLESIINQTYSYLEIILVDDGSNDASGRICARYAKQDARIKVIHQENRGAAAARNQGLAIAKGELIGFVDADDWICYDMYAYLYKLMTEHNADISMCSFTRKENLLKQKELKEEVQIYEGEKIWNYFYRKDGQPSCYSIWNRLYKREVIGEIRFREGMTTEDLLFIYDVYHKIKKMVGSNKIKYTYFINNNGVTRSKLCRSDFSLLTIWDEIVNRERQSVYREYAILNRARATYTLYLKACRYGRDTEVDKSILMQWRKEIRKNRKMLINGNIFDWKRKLLLLFI